MKGAQLLPLSCLLASLPVLAAEPADKELPKAAETMVVTGTAMKVEVPMAETLAPSPWSTARSWISTPCCSSTSPCATAPACSPASTAPTTTPTGSQVRGFDAAQYLDGNRLFGTGYYVWTPEPFGLESVELLKGPASILYGEAPPGGVINAISKRPTATPQGLVNLQLGNRDLRQVGVDFSDDLTDDSRYRMVALYKERDGVLDGTTTSAPTAPSVTWTSRIASLTLLASFLHDEGCPQRRFFPVWHPEHLGRPDRSRRHQLVSPDYDRNPQHPDSTRCELAHQFSRPGSSNQNVVSTTTWLLRQTYIFPDTKAPPPPWSGHRDGD